MRGRCRYTRTLVFALLAAVQTLAQSTVGQNAAPTYSLTITLANDHVKAGSDVRIDIVMKNISGHDMDVGSDVGTAERSYDVVAKAENGSLAAKTPWGQKMHDPKFNQPGTGSYIIGTLSPGKTLSRMLFVSKIYDLSRPGKYTIQISQTNHVTNVVVKSNTVTLTVTP